MLKQKFKIKKILSSKLHIAVLLLVMLVSASGGIVKADTYDNQIQQLEQQNAAKEQAVSGLQIQANNYQDAINKLQGQIDQIEGKILDTQNKQTAVKKQIASVTNQLNHQKSVLSDAIKAMYIDGQVSTAEVLLSSSDLSNFVDQEQYHLTVENNIKALVDKITALKAKLKAQNDQLTSLLNEQKTQKSTLDNAQGEKARLLGLNQSQQASYNQQIAANNQRIQTLVAEQEAALAKLGGGTAGTYGAFAYRNLSAQQSCGGGYHYCWAGKDEYVSDTWGLHLARECVHYAADRAAWGMNLAPYLGGAGNAEQWPSSLGSHFVVDHTPAQGAVAIVAWPGGGGHAMYVEYLESDGWVHVSQMNWDVQGSYSTMDVKDSGVMFVHFDEPL